MSDDLPALLRAAVEEAIRLRLEASLPGPHAPGGELLECLLDVRSRLDRVEELLGNTLRVRHEIHRRATAVRIEVEDAWDLAAVRARNSGVRDEYSSAKERTAATNLEVLDQLRAARTVDEQVRRCDEAVEQIRLRHRGLADVRQDIHTIIKALQFESTLDR